MKIDNKKTVTFWLHFVFANNNCKSFSYLCLNGAIPQNKCCFIVAIVSTLLKFNSIILRFLLAQKYGVVFLL